MSLDSLIIALIILILYFVYWTSRSQPQEGFIEDYKETTGMKYSGPSFSSGGRQRIADIVVTDLSGDWRTRFGEKEGDFYARYFSHDPSARREIENPTYRTATTF